MNVLALCSGGGGLDLGLRLAVPEARTVAYVEREAFAAAHLVAAMEAGALDAAPVWSDVRTFDARPWRGKVDCITAGYPCQPFSVAGKVSAKLDERHLWPFVRKAVEDCEPGMVFLENVPNHVRHGLDDVAFDLRSLGFTVAATLWSASEVNAPHVRKRLFILAAHPQRVGLRQLQQWAAAGRNDVQAGGQAQPALDGEDRPVAGWAEADWATEPDVGRMVDGVAAGVHRLRMLGNGVVPLQACRAFQEMAATAERIER